MSKLVMSRPSMANGKLILGFRKPKDCTNMSAEELKMSIAKEDSVELRRPYGIHQNKFTDDFLLSEVSRRTKMDRNVINAKIKLV